MPTKKKVSPKKIDRKILIGLIAITAVVLVFIIGQVLKKALPQVMMSSRASAPAFDMAIGREAMVSPEMSKGIIEDGVNISNPNPATPIGERSRIMTALLSLFVDNVPTTIEQVKRQAESVGGYTQNATIYENDNRTITGSVTVRVPASSFNPTISEIKKLAVKVERESTNSDDVTEQLIDVETRIANLKALETNYRSLLNESTKIEDTLRITQELANVRSQIESFEAQQKYLTQSVDLSTITVELKAVADVEVFGLTWKPLIIIKQALRDVVAGLINYLEWMIRIVFYLPVLAVWVTTIVLVIIGGFKLGTLIYRQFKK